MAKTKLPLFLGIAAAVALICLVAALGLLYFVLEQTDSSSRISRPAPDFSLASLNGQSLSLEQFRGKPVLLNFWATWCGPCIAELPLFDETAQRYAGELVVLGINEGDSFEIVDDFQKTHRLSYPILLDYNREIGDLYQVGGYPTSVFIDGEGVIRAIYLGEIPPAQLKRNLRLIGIK